MPVVYFNQLLGAAHTQNVWKWTKKTWFSLLLKADWHAKAGWLPEGVPRNCLFSVDYLLFLTFFVSFRLISDFLVEKRLKKNVWTRFWVRAASKSWSKYTTDNVFSSIGNLYPVKMSFNSPPPPPTTNQAKCHICRAVNPSTKESIPQAGHRGSVGLCTCKIPGGWWFKSRHRLVPSIQFLLGGYGKWKPNLKHWFHVVVPS